ncbi:MAG TPA: NAD-dependent epimerase/dehydratase family protein [bacterium]|nr:NAD-dependent epimerase/dehydratase family protein [bacterium]
MILVTGATGYIGSHLVAGLRNEGLPVVCLVRKETSPRQIQFLTSCGATTVCGDLLQPDQLVPLLTGKVTRVVHLVGSIVASRKESFDTVHRGKTAALVALCKRIGVEKIVLLTAVGAAADAGSEYGRTKWLAEEEVRKSGIPYMILRASLVFGNLGALRNSKMLVRLAELVRRTPFVPVMGNGKNRIQPVFIGDLVTCLIKAVTDDKLAGKTVDIAGPEQMPFDRLIDLIADHYELRRIKVHIPIPLIYPAAFLLEKILPVPPVSRDQLKLLQTDNVCDIGEMKKLFPVRLATFAEEFKL